MIFCVGLMLATRTFMESDLGSFLGQRAVSVSNFACRVPAPYVATATYSTWESLKSSLNLKTEFNQREFSGVSWDSSNLHLKYVPFETDQTNQSRLSTILNVFREVGEPAGEMLLHSYLGFNYDKGLHASDVKPEVIQQLQAVIPGSAQVFTANDARITWQVSTYLIFTGKNGTTKTFPVDPASANHKPIDLQFLRSAIVPESRVPRTLKQLLNSQLTAISKDSLVFKLGDIIKSLRETTAVPMYCDSRVAKDNIYLSCRSGSIPSVQLADLLAQTMDMYWRKVGNVYLLATSPGDPREFVRRRYFQKDGEKSRAILGFLSTAGYLPSETVASDFLGDPVQLADLDSNLLRALADHLQYPPGENSQTFDQLLQDPNFQNGTVELSVGGMLDAVSVSARFETGVGITLLGARN